LVFRTPKKSSPEDSDSDENYSISYVKCSPPHNVKTTSFYKGPLT